MEVELLEIQNFLAELRPFNLLPEETLKLLPEQLEIIYLKRGKHFPPHDNRFYVVRSGALEFCQGVGRACEPLEEGGVYASSCALLDVDEFENGRALEDTLLYMGDCELLYHLSQEVDEFGDYFTSSVRERLRKAVANLQPETGFELNNNQRVSEVIRYGPVCIASHESIQAAAAGMTEKGVSSLLITEKDKLVGIITDQDLRKRCIAPGLSFDTPVSEIMTREPYTIEQDISVSEALLHMTRLGVHHLPVMGEEEVLGMFTATDVVLNQGGNAALLATSIGKARDIDDLIESCTRIPALHHQLVRSGANSAQLGETLSHMTDAITVRLLQLAEEQLGPAPVPYVWLAGGSQGRGEQSSHSDQDNALLIADEMQAEHGDYFEEMARIVTDGLDACGFVYCPGEAMASNPKWRQPLSKWIGYFDRWILSPEPMALMLSSIWFDLRPVHGDFQLFDRLQATILPKARGSHFFLAYMMANAMKHRPPLGFFRQFVLVHDGQHNDTLDLKHTGIVPVTDIARVLALAGGIEEVNTLRRLQRAAEQDLLSKEMAENLQDALKLISGLRVRHQAEQIARGEQADNFLNPNDLASLERGHLKDAFRVIQTQQEVMTKRYGAENLR